MKKNNKMMRYAAIILALVLATSCVVGNTFAKYTTSVNSSDTARVANWGFQGTAFSLATLFKTSYDGNGDASVVSSDANKVVAPGTSGYAPFSFAYSGAKAAPEVSYTFTVDPTASSCATSIQNNANIRFALTTSSTTPANYDKTWTQLIAAIKALSGDASGTKTYAPGELPAAFNNNQTYYVHWVWNFSTNAAGDTADTAMGNANPLDAVTVAIAVTATQTDTYTPPAVPEV